MKPLSLVMNCIVAVAVMQLQPCFGELVFNPSVGTVAGDVRVTQSPIGSDWVNVLVEVQTSAAYNTIAGGFRTLDGALFSQDAGELDTTFLFTNASGLPFELGKTDSQMQLSLESRSQLGGDFGPTDQFNPIVQLVLAPGASAEAFGFQASSGSPDFALISPAGVVIGTISGSVTAVPEPSSVAGIGVAFLGWLGYRYKRRRRLSLAA